MLIDLILLLPAILIVHDFVVPMPTPQEQREIQEIFSDRLTDSERDRAYVRFMVWIADQLVFVSFVFGAYCVLTESSTLQATLGKRALGLRVADLNGRRLKVGRAIGRYLAHMISAIPWLLGFVMVGFTTKKQALHDFLAGTVVVVADDTVYCPTCSVELPKRALYCHRCGAAVRRQRTNLRYAGFWRRVVAVAIDFVVLLPTVFAAYHFLIPMPSQEEWRAVAQIFGNELSNAERQAIQARFTTWYIQQAGLLFFTFGVYYVLTESSGLQGTVGKRCLRMRVTDLDGRRIRLGRALRRYLARLLSAVPWQIGFIMAAFTPEKQALHDVLAGTLVVVTEKSADTNDSTPASA